MNKIWKRVFTSVACASLAAICLSGCSKKEGEKHEAPSETTISQSTLPTEVFPDVSAKPPGVRKQIGDAVSRFKEKPDNAKANADLAILYHLYGFNEAADVFYHRAVSLDPKEKLWPYFYARLLVSQKQEDKALEWFEEATRRDSQFLLGYIQLADRFYKRGDKEKAGKIVDTILEKDPQNAFGFYTRARLLFDEGEYEQAIDLLKKVTEPVSSNSSRKAGAAHRLLADAYEKVGKEQDAEKHRILGASPFGLDLPDDPFREKIGKLDRGSGYELQKVDSALKQNQIEKALSLITQITNDDPTNPRIPMDHSNLLLRMKKSEEAIQVLKKAIERIPDEAGLHSQLGEILQIQGDNEGAEKEFRKAISIDSEFYPAQLTLAVLQNNMGKREEAITTLNGILKNKPEYADARLSLASILYSKESPDQAVAEFNKVLEQNPTNATAHNELAAHYHFAGDIDKAVYHLKSGIEALPTNQKAYLFLMDIYFSKGQYGLADEVISEAYRNMPRTPLIINCRAWLFATSPDIAYRNGKAAVELMEPLCQLPQFRQPLYLDTLAAAYAEVGDFEQARNLQNELLEIYRSNNVEIPAEYLERLELFEQEKPYRLPREGTRPTATKQ